ncbi:MAG: GNAT family N-acetyltransferase [Firmicutes bacterium]|nr:GNAT family N-acetyltransferase [Bacillota bacterium]
MQTQEKICISKMTHKDLEMAIDWAAGEGWNPGLHDAECFYEADHNGFFIARIGDEPIGTISAVSYSGIFGFIGLFIIKPDQRRSWTAFHLAKAASRHLQGCNVGLDGVLERVDNYSRLGFSYAYKNARYEGIAEKSGFSGVVELSDIPFEEIAEYDTRMFSAPRPEFLKRWINQPDGAAFGTLDKGEISGYGVIRKCREGYKIGPLFADNQDIADNLFKALSGVAAGERIYLDVPLINSEAVNLAKKYNMKIVFETARMYSEKTDFLPIDKIFGITSFELG